MQLKLDHKYFKFYLIKFLNYLLNRYFTCDIKKSSKYLILYCKNTKYVRNGLKKKFNIKELSLKNLFNTKIGQEFLFKFIEKT